MPNSDSSLNAAERLQEHIVQKYISVLHHAQALQITHYDVLRTLVTAADTALTEVDAQKDQAMFIDYNIRPFSMPTDWTFEPCASHYDTVYSFSFWYGLHSYRM